MPETHHILLYDYVDDILERRGPHRDAHLAHVHGDDRIVMAGPLGDPPHGAAIVFRTEDPDAAEEFAQADPYVKAGLVSARRVELWNVI
jgi:uncharacterized protein